MSATLRRPRFWHNSLAVAILLVGHAGMSYAQEQPAVSPGENDSTAAEAEESPHSNAPVELPESTEDPATTEPADSESALPDPIEQVVVSGELPGPGLWLALYSKAIQKAGLSERPVTAPVVFKTAKKYKVPSKTADIKIDVDNPRQLIKDFTETPRDTELACFIGAMEHLNADIEAMRLRANAWAVGDVETFSKHPRPAQYSACFKALTSAPGLQDEFGTVEERMKATWLAGAESALAAHDVSISLMGVDEILSEDGPLAQLRARGYTVESP